MDLKSNTIVRGHTVTTMNSLPVSRSLVTRSNSLRKADSPPTLRPNRMPPPLPEHDVVDSMHNMPISGQNSQIGSMPVPPLISQHPQQQQHPQHPHHPHPNHNHSAPHLNHPNFNQFRNTSQPSMPPMPPHMSGANPSQMQPSMKQQLSLNVNQNQNFKNGFNSNTPSVNNISPNNNNNIWSNRAKFSVLPQPQQPVIPQHPFPPNPSHPHFAPQSLPSHPQQMKQQLGPHQTSQQRAKSPVHSVPQLMAHNNQSTQLNEQTNGPQMPYQTSQPMMSSMPIQTPSHSVATQPTGQHTTNSQNAYPYPHQNQGQLHSQHSNPINGPTIGQQTREQSPQQPSPQMMPSSQAPPKALPSPQPPPQQSQQRLSHEQFRAALQLVVSPGDPRFVLNTHILNDLILMELK